jgi:V8-like Glu-specific endopeptidase
MFRQICKANREAIYGVLCQSPIGENQLYYSNGTAFMIAPGICATAAHILHLDGDINKPVHKTIEIIRAPDVGNHMLTATIVAEDKDRNLALLKLESPTNISVLKLHSSKIESGSNCGVLGFPLASVLEVNNKMSINLIERFQGSNISAYRKIDYTNDKSLYCYEMDSLMYGGSSGCPGFTIYGNVFGMHIATVGYESSDNQFSRFALDLWLPSMDIISFANSQNITDLEIM